MRVDALLRVRRPGSRFWLRVLRLLVGVVAGVLSSGVAAAQSGPGPYLPLESWEHDVADRLRARGLLPGVSGLTRPYRSDLVRRALARVERAGLSPLERQWIERLDSALAPLASGTPDAAPSLRWQVGVAPEVQAGSSVNRDRFFQWGEGGKWPALELEGVLVAGPVVLHTVPRFDWRPVGDLRYWGNTRWWGYDVSYREETAYALAAWGHVSLFLGRVGRNWGPDAEQSLNLSNIEYPYSQLAWSLEFGPLRFTQLVGDLNEIGGYARRLFAHRMEARFGGLLDVALTRSYLRSSLEALPTGIASPLGYGTGNTFHTIDLLWRVGRRTEVFGQALHDKPRGDSLDPSIAIEVGIRDAGRWNPLDLELSYTMVGAQTYRPKMHRDFFLFWNTGLGLDRSDFDRVTLKATLHPHPNARFTLALEHVRQGEGDPRQLRARAPTPPWLLPPAQIITRVGLDGLVRVGRDGQLRVSWGPLRRSSRIYEEGARNGWSTEGWIYYRHYLRARGRISRPVASQADS